MKISGSNVVAQPVDKVWDALLDPRVLVATIPGCERLEATGDNTVRHDRHRRVSRRSRAPTTARARSRTSRSTSRW